MHTPPITGVGGRPLIAFVPIVVLSAIAISGVSAVSGLRSGERQVINQLESVATLQEAEIETWLSGLTANLSIMLAGGNAIERANELLEGTPAAGGHQEAYDELQGRFQQTIAQVGLFEQVLLIYPQGQVVLSTNAAKEGKSLSNEVYFQQGSMGAYVHPPSYSRALGRMAVVAALPVVDRQGHTMGVLASRASMGRLNEIMLERAGLGETGNTYLVGANHAC